jgi:enamine deaminase RidA (YjgF/YER057c/UK114 family)
LKGNNTTTFAVRAKNFVFLDQMSIPRTAAHTDKAPQPYGGLYSQAVIANGVLYCSGIVAIHPETGKLIDGDVKAHTVRKSTPYSFQCVVKTLIKF